MIYCIDTSAFIDAWREFSSDILPDLWGHSILASIHDGTMISPEEVLSELTRGGDDLYRWAKSNGQLFLPPDDDVQNSVTRILTDFPTVEHNADLFVIALAMAKGAIVVTHEKKRGYRTNPNAIPKIPDVCERYGVQCITFSQLMHQKGWKFYVRT